MNLQKVVKTFWTPFIKMNSINLFLLTIGYSIYDTVQLVGNMKFSSLIPIVLHHCVVSRKNLLK